MSNIGIQHVHFSPDVCGYVMSVNTQDGSIGIYQKTSQGYQPIGSLAPYQKIEMVDTLNQETTGKLTFPILKEVPFPETDHFHDPNQD